LNALFAICQKDPRYDLEAYIFLREALAFTVQNLEKPDSGPKHHVTGRELAEGFRDYALEQFGPLTHSVLAAWGIHRTNDIGAMVFNLVEAGELGKTPEDKPEDFNDLYDFEEAFTKPFQPSSKKPETP
jgi:uncharacterized repeat protein (TIGR04138 family)